MRRRLLRWALAVILGMLALVGSLAAWLLYTESGLQFALTRGISAAGGSLEYGDLRGTLAGGFELDSPRIELPGVRISAAQLRMRLVVARLWHAEVQLEALRLTGARYTLLPATEQTPSAAGRPGRIDLPFAIVLRNIELIANELDMGGAEPIPFSAAASEISLRGGQLAVAGLALRQGDFALRASAAVDTGAEWAGELDTEGEWTLPAVLHRGEVRVKGNLDAVDLSVALQGAGSLSFTASLNRPLDAPGIAGKLGAARLDLSSFGIDAPVRLLDLGLDFVWADGKLDVSGPIRVDERALDLKLTGLEFLPQRLRVELAELGSPETGTVALRGQWPTASEGDPGSLNVELRQTWAGDWRKALDPMPTYVDGKLDLTGHTRDWKAQLNGSWKRGEVGGALAVVAAGTPERIDLAPSRIGLAQGSLDLEGNVALGAVTTLGLDLKLQALDPGLLAPEWPGALDGPLRVEAELGAQSRWSLTAADIKGSLRSAPFTLTGQLSGLDAQPDKGALQVRWGSSQVGARVNAAGALDLDLQALDLALLGPYVGRLSGTLSTQLDGDLMDLTVAKLQVIDVGGYAQRIKRIDIDKRSGWNLSMSAHQVDASGTAVEQVDLTLSGSAMAHRLNIRMRSAQGRLELGLDGSWANPIWNASLDQLELTPAKGAPWTLVDSAKLRLEGDNLSLTPACLSAAAASVCIGLTRSEGASRASIDIKQLPLQQLQAWAADSDWQVAGTLSGGGELTLSAEGNPGGLLNLRIENGALRGRDASEAPIEFSGNLSYAGSTQAFGARLELPGHGQLQAQASGVGQANGQWQAQLDLTDLSFVDGLSAEVQSMRGGLGGELHGPLADLSRVEGLLETRALSFELPALGLKADQGVISLRLDGDGMLRVDGNLGIAPGTLRIEGVVGLDGKSHSQVRIRSENAGLIDLPAVRLAGDTNFLIQHGDAGFSIEGGILLRQGFIDLDRFAPGVPASEDVVIEDAPPAGPTLPITANVSIAMIQAVDLRGFGLEASLNGGVRVTQLPGKKARAQGEMVVKGVYEAYGQKLDIERGRLGFGGGRADRPSLDILAVKRVDRQRVGVQVRGNAQRPLIRLYSDPSLDQSETLSYLVLGRPLATASGADSAQLGEYASALETAGGSLVAGSIGKKLGLAAGVESFGSAIGSALVVGKYLSPRFFIGYGTSLLDATQLVILRFRLTENIELEGISGTEQKASISWRTER